MADLDMGLTPLVNFPLLDQELRAALPDKLDGISMDKTGRLTVHIKQGVDAESLRAQIAAVILAHDPSVKTERQAANERQLQAAADLALEDFAQVRDAINGLSVADPIKAVLRRMNRNTARLALAIKASTGTDPGA